MCVYVWREGTKKAGKKTEKIKSDKEEKRKEDTITIIMMMKIIRVSIMMMAIVKWWTMNKIVIRGNAFVMGCEKIHSTFFSGLKSFCVPKPELDGVCMCVCVCKRRKNDQEKKNQSHIDTHKTLHPLNGTTVLRMRKKRIPKTCQSGTASI